MRSTTQDARKSIRIHLLVATVAGAFLVLGAGGWAATTNLSGAVIAPGRLVAETNVKLVQHPTGGVITDLNVSEGDVVEAGDVLAHLDDTAIRASLEIVVQSLRQLEARQARLQAEVEGAQSVVFPESLMSQSSNPEAAGLMTAEVRLFELRRMAIASQKGQLQERVLQLRDEITGIETQITAKQREKELLETELVSTRALLANKLVSSERVAALDRELARTEGQLGELVAAAAQARGKIAEVELQAAQIEQTFRSDSAVQLSDDRAKSAELEERRVAGEVELAKATIRAPQGGQVHELAVHTLGGVLAAGEVLMRIVPIAEALTVEVDIAPQDIDQVYIGQKVLVRFSAFNVRTTPEAKGTVARLAPDLTRDQRTGMAYYTARIVLDDEEASALPDLALISGMPVEAFIHTGERTALGYLTKPLTDQIMRAFRGD
ncbi:HlyD family type I secretion periplasmic adaptor subunit [Devosia oryziradicis]|uniref:Membrane fusion protein (MFP) family protein n=1 Tax=Devosia oryziradicis TaxID=2801335 RepID=A0ABX7BW87_9HYPH|nr:HlyD family type I secretion periplasmic adaptor subunit [Devosia oryziradicis]QQR35324.1 HlyD family type I secretion periplasmic adaptor subunit [Devosia oryziradicis]